jgi:hypothetical protein
MEKESNVFIPKNRDIISGCHHKTVSGGIKLCSMYKFTYTRIMGRPTGKYPTISTNPPGSHTLKRTYDLDLLCTTIPKL